MAPTTGELVQPQTPNLPFIKTHTYIRNISFDTFCSNEFAANPLSTLKKQTKTLKLLPVYNSYSSDVCVHDNCCIHFGVAISFRPKCIILKAVQNLCHTSYDLPPVSMNRSPWHPPWLLPQVDRCHLHTPCLNQEDLPWSQWGHSVVGLWGIHEGIHLNVTVVIYNLIYSEWLILSCHTNNH